MAEEPSFKKREIWLGRFSKGRLKEMNELKDKVKKRKGQLPSQRVPHHMRRRAVSHNPNRLPQRLRDKHTKERIAGGGGGIDGSKPKRPNRRYRRRPTQLLTEYNRRQSKNGIWLETHIWHAKRFRMTTQKWGMRLPEAPNDKGYRLAYRATKSKCIMFDMSYYKLYELSASDNSLTSLIKGLNSLLPPHQIINSSVLPTSYLHLHVYEPNSYPYGYIGQVSIHSIQRKGPMDACWIWVHPSYAVKVLEVLQVIFCLDPVQKNENLLEIEKLEVFPIEDDEVKNNASDPGSLKSALKVDLDVKEPCPESEPLFKKSKLNVNEMKLAPRNIPFERTPKYNGPDVSLYDLSFSINRYRLTGPHVDRILKATLKPSSIYTNDKTGWWNDFYSDSKSASSFEKQAYFWGSQTFIPNNVDMISLTTRDPRIILPPKRNVIPNEAPDAMDSTSTLLESDLYDLKVSPLWDSEIRDEVSYSKCPDHVINDKRSKFIVPGSEISLSDSESRIPIVLLRRKYDTDGYGEGWDFISPAGWGMSFWMCFVMHGARVGGQTEIRNADFERGSLHILGSSPDSLAGQREAEEAANLDKELYFRYPPDKRCNFRKTGFDSPYLPKWKFLINDWIRDENPLVRHSKNKHKPNDSMISDFYVLRDPVYLSKLSSSTDEALVDRKCLIPVSVKIIGKGTISKNAGIFIPTERDLEVFRGDEESWHLLTEPIQDDKKEMCLRETLKSEHTGKKINLRRKWKKVKDKLGYLRQKNLADKNLDKEIQFYQSSLNDLKNLRNKEILEYEVKMRTLWFDMDEAKTFKDSSTRSVCGYIVNSNFSLRKGAYIGLGFVAYPSIKHMNADSVLLIRDNNSFQYRFVKMSIIANNDSI